MRPSYLSPVLALAPVVALTLTACAVRDIRNEQQAVTDQTRAQLAQTPTSRPVVKMHKGAWLMGEQIVASKPQPSIYDKPVSYTYPAGSLAEVAQWITRTTGVRTAIDSSVTNPAPMQASFPAPAGDAMSAPLPPGVPGSLIGQPIPQAAAGPMAPDSARVMTYRGTFKGFLDQQQARFGVWHRYRDGVITFFKRETRVFPLPALSETSAMESSITTSSNGAMGASGGGNSGGTAGGNSQLSTLKVTIAPWKQLQATASAIAGSGATVAADPDLGVLVVTGTPAQCDAIDGWMKSLTAMYSKTIAVDIHLYSVRTDHDENYGLDLALGYKSATGHTSVGITGAATPAISGGGSGMSFGASILSGPFSGTKGAIKALSSLGNVTTLLSNAGVTQNGKKVTLQDGEQIPYLPQTQSTLAANVGSLSSASGQFQPVGFTGQFLPKLVNGTIVMDFSLTLSRLIEMVSLPAGCNAKSTQSCLQMPHLKNYDLQQIVPLKPGESLVLVGMQRADNSTQDNGVGSPFNPVLGGGVDARQQRTLLAIVITARLL
ncbi:TPA: type II secretion system protein GspD [Burkholderia orbicola]|nr:pilus assembly protein PilN [Burkholderia cenocepacia]